MYIDVIGGLTGRRSRAFAVVLCVGLLASPVARAQAVDAATAAAAEKLFEDGRTLMSARRFEEACPRLAESLRLAPATGTMLNLAECYEQTGRMASAWATYRRAETAARRQGHRARLDFATEGVERTATKLAFLTIDVTERVPGLLVKRDDETVGSGGFGVAVPVDPGTHVVSATAEGRVPWKAEVGVGAEQRVHVAVPALAQAPVETAGPTSSLSTSTGPAVDGSNGGGAQRTVGWIVAGAGAVGLGVGFAFGLVAKSKNDEARQNECTRVSCTSRGGALIDEADRAATLSTVLVVAGAAAAVGGIVLVLTAPRGPQLHASVRGSMLELGGSF